MRSRPTRAGRSLTRWRRLPTTLPPRGGKGRVGGEPTGGEGEADWAPNAPSAAPSVHSPPSPTLPPSRGKGALLAASLLLFPPLCAASPPPARALLIGVGDYPALPETLHLAAPAQDVERLSAALVGAGL